MVLAFELQAELEAHRAEFWDTRVEGDPLVWSTLRVAADAALGGDLGTAAAILSVRAAILPPGSFFQRLGGPFIKQISCVYAGIGSFFAWWLACPLL